MIFIIFPFDVRKALKIDLYEMFTKTIFSQGGKVKLATTSMGLNENGHYFGVLYSYTSARVRAAICCGLKLSAPPTITNQHHTCIVDMRKWAIASHWLRSRIAVARKVEMDSRASSSSANVAKSCNIPTRVIF